jgi:hypothetical protein
MQLLLDSALRDNDPQSAHMLNAQVPSASMPGAHRRTIGRSVCTARLEHSALPALPGRRTAAKASARGANVDLI